MAVRLVVGLIFFSSWFTGYQAQDYKLAVKLALRFYEQQRSGALPSDTKKRFPWKADSALSDSVNGYDLSGGYYDAGDHVKFTFPMCFAMSQLGWTVKEFEKELAAIHDEEYGTDLHAYALRQIRWGLDWLMKAFFASDKLVAQVGNANTDHAFWGRPQDMKMARPAYVTSQGADLWAACSAAMLTGYHAFRTADKDYALKLLDKGTQMYQRSLNTNGLHINDIPQNQRIFYNSQSTKDDQLWAAALLLRSTATDQRQLTRVTLEQHVARLSQSAKGSAGYKVWGWDNAYWGGVTYSYAYGSDTSKFEADMKDFARSWLPGGSIKYTPAGLAWSGKWGVLRQTASAATLALVYANKLEQTCWKGGQWNCKQTEQARPNQLRCWAQGQVNYMLGKNPQGRSYMVGFGSNYPLRPHHRGASCPRTGSCGWGQFSSSSPNPNILYGALVGGPDAQDRYKDDRADYVRNEVTLDYNSALVGALAALSNPANRCKKARLLMDAHPGNDTRHLLINF